MTKKSRFGDILKAAAAKEPELEESIDAEATPLPEPVTTAQNSELTQVPKKRGRPVGKRTTEGYVQTNVYLDEQISLDLNRFVLDYNSAARKAGVDKVDRSEVIQQLLQWLLKEPDPVTALRQLQK